MKVLLLNGSPHARGCTYTALCEIEKVLTEEGIETEILHMVQGPVLGCTACRACKTKPGRCVYDNDVVNMILEKAEQADGFVFGSPVYFASPNGSMLALMDRLFYAGNGFFAHKPAAAVVSARRGGTTAALDVLHKYFALYEMPVATSKYWNMVHGNTPDEVLQDLEGMQTMRVLARNLSWLIKSGKAAREAGVPVPAPENEDLRTNFIR